MSLDWSDRDLLEWAQRTLPEFLLICMQDPDDRNQSIASTPWSEYELSIAEVQLEGEVNLIGRKNEPMLQFDLDLGMRVDVEKKVVGRPKNDETDYWPGIVQIVHFDNENPRPALITRLEELPEETAQEVGWYLQEGMGSRLIWHGLARWRAYAAQKWLKQNLVHIEDPRANPETPPAFPPFLHAARKRYEEEIRQILLGPDDEDEDNASENLQNNLLGSQLSFQEMDLVGLSHGHLMSRRILSEAEGHPGFVSPPVSDDEDDFDPTAPYEFVEGTYERKRKGAPQSMKKFGRYPFMPSMLAGLGGPAKDWLPPKEHAIGHPEWFQGQGHLSSLAPSSLSQPSRLLTNGVTHLDTILEKARKRREEFEASSTNKLISMKAADLCAAIENGDVMKTFAKLDEKTASCPHPDTGRCAAHYCIARGSHELLRMVLEARADPDARDSFGQTPLMMAAKQGDQEAAQVLLDAGADAAATDSLGRAASEMVKVVQKSEEEEHNPLKNWREKMAGQPLPEDPAKKSRDLKVLIDSKERPKKFGLSLLTALAQRDVRTAEAAMEAGADMKLVDDKGDTAIILIVKGKWKDTQGLQVRLLQKAIKAGADVNFQNCQGNSALHFASHRGDLDVIEALLSLKANAKLVNAEGNTALMYAAHGGYEEICTALLEAAAPVTVANRAGLTAETMAERKGFKTCAALIHAYELAPKEAQAKVQPKKKESGFDFSKWDSLEREMRADEEEENNTRLRENNAAVRRPTPKFEDLGPEAFGLPADTPWPPDATLRKKGPFDYGHWDKIVEDVERQEKVLERYEKLQKDPKYEYRDGQKMQVIY